MALGAFALFIANFIALGFSLSLHTFREFFTDAYILGLSHMIQALALLFTVRVNKL